MKETFGQRFSRLRKQLGLKQETIAEKLNITAQAVSKWENDLSAPDISALPLLADILNVSLDELLGREVIQTMVVPEGERKEINSMLLKINVLSADGDKIRVNLPVSIIKVCLETGMKLPNINGKDSLKNIDFNQIFTMLEAGIIGKLVEVESADGDTVSITVE
ncbi:MAG: helix-turn-helix transcriptional regulator [Clostridia bacterium]|nr:helix-turn-helix transcriptional regulator [Clostridia bacterium]